jgi:hypothetical protein
MSITTAQPATPPIPVQLSEPEVTACILPHRSMPKRGPKGTLGYYRVFHLIVWVLDPGMPWQGVPVPTDAQGKPAIHYTTIYKVFARWADDGSLWQAFVASVRHLAAEKQLDLRVLHGDGTTTMAKKGAMALASRGTNTRRARRSWPSWPILAPSERPSPWHPAMRPIWCCCRRAYKR